MLTSQNMMLISSVIAIIGLGWALGVVWAQFRWLARLERLEGFVGRIEAAHRRRLDRVDGLINKAVIESRVSSKMSERSFSLASAANVGVAILGKAIQSKPIIPTKHNQAKAEVAQKSLIELLGEEESEYIKPLLDDEELELLEKAQEEWAKKNGMI